MPSARFAIDRILSDHKAPTGTGSAFLDAVAAMPLDGHDAKGLIARLDEARKGAPAGDPLVRAIDGALELRRKDGCYDGYDAKGILAVIGAASATDPVFTSVNLRAVVVALADGDDTGNFDPQGWEVYDREAREDGAVEYRMDAVVRVREDLADEAVLAAEAAAPEISSDGWSIEGVDYWVDRDLDLNPDHAAGADPKPN